METTLTLETLRTLPLKTRTDLAENPETTAEQLAILASDTTIKVKTLVAKHPTTTTETLDVLSDETERSILLEVASNPNSARETLLKLINRRLSYVSRIAYGNPALTAEDLQKFNLSKEHKTDLARNPNCPEYLILETIPKKFHWLSTSITRSPAMTTRIARKIITCSTGYPPIRSLAGNPHCPEPILYELAFHEEITVRSMLANNPELSNRIIDVLLKDKSKKVISNLVKTHPSKVTREAAIQSGSIIGKRHVARLTDDPEEAYALCYDSNKTVRANAIRNTICPEEGQIAVTLIDGKLK